MPVTIRSYRRFLHLVHCLGFGFLLTLLLLSSGPTYAEWVPPCCVNDGVTVCVDTGTAENMSDECLTRETMPLEEATISSTREITHWAYRLSISRVSYPQQESLAVDSCLVPSAYP
jgi:hypothetical protein